MSVRNSQKSCAVAIVTWNSAREIAECLAPLEALPENWEVWVADNASSDETVKIIVEKFPVVNVIANAENLGFAEACNQISNRTATDFVLFLNPDSIAAPSELEKALNEIAANEGIGILGVKIRDQTGKLQKTCFRFPTLFNSLIEKLGIYRLFSANQKRELLLGDYFDHRSSRETDWLYGAFMLARRAAIEKVGGIPEDYFLFAEDLDFCYRVRKSGYRIWYSADAEIVHKGNQSAGQMPSEWRVERTVSSYYAFCFIHFGWLRTRLIQLIDLTGNYLESAIVRFRKADSSFAAEAKIYRKFIKKALKMSRAEIFTLLHRRPENLVKKSAS